MYKAIAAFVLVFILAGCATQQSASCSDMLTPCGGAPNVGYFGVPSLYVTYGPSSIGTLWTAVP